jgi:pyruvate dehydrogenase E2 component (dihydrolipoamide acetyltransferase)
MAHILIMPRQGNTVESCIISEWRVKDGDQVQADTTVCVVETDKATFEIPAGAAGTILKILHPAGDDVPVLQPIMVVGNPGETFSVDGPAASAAGQTADQAAAAPAAQPAAPAAAVQASVPQSTAAPSVSGAAGDSRRAVSPRARTLAGKEALSPADLAGIPGSGPGGRIIERDVRAALESRPPLTAAAKAEQRGIGGRITLAQLNAGAAALGGTSGGAKLPGTALSGGPEYTEAPVKGIRKVIADQMMLSHTSTAAFTLNASAPALALQKIRARFKASDPELGMSRITINDLVLFAVSRVLPLYPVMNALKIIDGTGAQSVRSYNTVHLGVAVATPRGLMVPVLQSAERLSLLDISRGSKALAESCRNGTISPDELHGSSFTVTNLGSAGVESFSPVINVPEVAILGVCAITPRPAETSPGQYEIVPHIGLSLTIDHAVVDGAPAAEFLKALCGALKDIDLWLAK